MVTTALERPFQSVASPNQAEHLQVDDREADHLPRDERAEEEGPARGNRRQVHRVRSPGPRAIRTGSHGYSGIRLQPGLSWALYRKA